MEELIFHLNFLTPGLNGANGLIRQHWTNAAALRDKLTLLFLSQKPKRMLPINFPVRIYYKRYTCRLMDWDNACASFKKCGDALVRAGILADDCPDVVHEFLPQQTKVKTKKEERTEIIIEF